MKNRSLIPLWAIIALLLLLTLGGVSFALRSSLHEFSYTARPQVISSARIAEPGTAPASPETTPFPSVTNTPPTSVPIGSFLLPEQVPPDMLVLQVTYEPEMPDPLIPEMRITPSPVTPWPSITPLPTASQLETNPNAAQNLVLEATSSLVAHELNDASLQFNGDAAWSPDEKYVAVSKGYGDYVYFPIDDTSGVWQRPTALVVLDSSGNEVGIRLDGQFPVWSPSGAYLASIAWHEEKKRGSINLIDTRTGTVHRIAELEDGYLHPTVIWVSESELLYYLGTLEKGSLSIFDTKSLESRPFITAKLAKEFGELGVHGYLGRVSSLPSRGLVAIATDSLVIVLRQASEPEIVAAFSGSDMGSAIFSPDGESIAFRSATVVHIASLQHEDGDVVRLGVGWPETWSPDGNSLVFSSDGAWLIANRDGSGLHVMEPIPAGTHRVVWLHDRLIAVNAAAPDYAEFSTVTR